MTNNAVNKPSQEKTTTALIILDGWGHREETDSNAIFHGNTPFWDQLWATAPKTLISTSGLDVGLPEGQMGNSEVGHMSLGAGRIVYQSISRIDKEIENGNFFANKAYIEAIDKAINTNKAVHILGLLSSGGVHSHELHIQAMVKMAAERGAKHVYVHVFTDGRDTPPRSAQASLQQLQDQLSELGCGRIASIVGRYYAMDRDNRWDRVELAYRLLTEGRSEYRSNSAINALQAAYERDENDEFVAATTIQAEGEADAFIQQGDAVIFMNFRADRAREITRAFVDNNFEGFQRDKLALADFVMTTEYAASIKTSCAYAPNKVVNSLGEYLENLNKTQLRIAETEKYAHVTFFFSGGREELYRGEDRILIPSPDVATYDLQPEMSAVEVTDKLVAAIESQQYDVIICNYANGDMVGHTGDFKAAQKAVEALDSCLERVANALEKIDGQGLVTADHGNCEQMTDYDSGQQHTQHTTELVPLVYLGNNITSMQAEGGRLCDIAPSILHLMDLDPPSEMTGKSLLTLTKPKQ